MVISSGYTVNSRGCYGSVNLIDFHNMGIFEVTELTNSSNDAKVDAAAAVILIAIFVTAAIVWLQGLA